MNEERKEQYMHQWRQKLRPYIAEVINRLNREEQERNLYAIKQGARNTCVSEVFK